MADLPSFFNRVDFVGKYLPGYVLVVSYVFLFESKWIFGSQTKLDVDLFTALVFIVAGPALGYTITHLHRSFPYIRNSIIGPKDNTLRDRLKRSVQRYAKLRTVLAEEEKAELDLAEAEYDFDVSAGIVFLVLEIITIYYVTYLHLKVSGLFNIIFIILAILLFVNAYHQLTRAVRPLIIEFYRKYKIR